jgi:hypothetical protein
MDTKPAPEQFLKCRFYLQICKNVAKQIIYWKQFFEKVVIRSADLIWNPVLLRFEGKYSLGEWRTVQIYLRSTF